MLASDRIPDEAYEHVEVDLSDCPYYREPGVGTCASGCWDEPACMTDRPREGWPAERWPADFSPEAWWRDLGEAALA